MIFTVYPRGWFEGRSRGGSGRAKQHAFESAEAPSRGRMTVAFCGVYGDASGNEFKAREGNAITCAKCAKEAKRREGVSG